MADATSLAVNTLVANGTKAITVDVNTAATGARTLAIDVGGLSDRIALRLKNNGTDATNTLSVTLSAGTNPPAFRAGIGAFTKTGLATASTTIFGPVETARFIGTDGKLSVIIASDGATNAAAIWEACVYKLPIV